MTEKTAQEIIDLLTLNGRKPEHIKNGERVVYLADAISIVKNALDDQDQTRFAVGEYYADNEYIYRIEQNDTAEVYVSAFNAVASIWTKAYWALVDIANDQPATAEQIATFKRAEHFASKGREWSEFRKGDIVQNIKTCKLGIVESVDEDGDALVNYNMDEPLAYPSCYKCTGALFLNLIQTAEELQEVVDE